MLLELLVVGVELLVALPDEALLDLHRLCARQAHVDVALDDLLEHFPVDRFTVAILGDLLQQYLPQILLNLRIKQFVEFLKGSDTQGRHALVFEEVAVEVVKHLV